MISVEQQKSPQRKLRAFCVLLSSILCNAGPHVFYSTTVKHNLPYTSFAPDQARYAERKLATGRAVSARFTARKTHQTRVWPPALPGVPYCPNSIRRA